MCCVSTTKGGPGGSDEGKKKNKKNYKKKGKVRIIAGVMMREQDSDSTLSPGGRGQKTGMSPPQQPNRWGDTRDHSHSEYFPKAIMYPKKQFVLSVGLLRIVIKTAR